MSQASRAETEVRRAARVSREATQAESPAASAKRFELATPAPQVNLQFPAKFAPWFRPHRYKVAKGGRGSAKSHSAAGALIWRCASSQTRWLCAREIQTSIKESVHRLLLDKIYAMNMTHLFTWTDSEIRGVNGSQIVFAGLRNNVAKIKSMEGLDGAWVEEADTTSDDSWSILIPTIRKSGSEIWVTYNPHLESDPVDVRFVQNTPPDTLLLEMNWQDNPWFPEELRKEKDYLYRVDPEAAAWVWGGQYRKTTGAAVFKDKWHVEAFSPVLWREADRPLYGADFGFAVDPSTLMRCFIVGNTLYVENEAWGVGVEIDHLPKFYAGVPYSKLWPIKADSARPETISYLRGRGWNVSAAKKWSGSVEDGIAYLRGFEKIVIHPRCRRTIEEARLYSYKVDKQTKQILPAIVDKHNHCWDAIRYALDGYITRSGDAGIYEAIAARVAAEDAAALLARSGVQSSSSDEVVI